MGGEILPSVAYGSCGSMNAVVTRMTAEEYLAVDYGDKRWRELIDGVVVVNEPLPPPVSAKAPA